jgi:signal transduction histidine kinase
MWAMRLSIASKVFLGFVAVLATGALASMYGIVRLHRIGSGLSLLSSSYFPLTQAVSTLDAFQKERERVTDRLLEETSPEGRASLLSSRSYATRALAERLAHAQQLTQPVSDSRPERELLDRVGARLSQVAARVEDEERAATAVIAALPRGRAAADAAELQEPIKRLKTAERRVDYELRSLVGGLQELLNGGVYEAERQERAARAMVLALSALALAVGVLVTWMSNRALRPIRELTEAAQRLGRGSPESVTVPEKGADELALLAREFNAMAQRLAARERELRAQGEALVRSERLAAIGRIAAQITHEIRNPLSSISLNADELGERAPQARELCDAIVREVDRLTAITEEYLRFARLPRPQLARADLNDTVRDLLDFVQPELSAAGVRLDRMLDPRLDQVLADVGQIRQLLLNLIRNAREAMPQGGAVGVTTRTDGGFAVVEVRDTGPGIPHERMQRIFDPFFTTKERGTGLGLAMAQEIAQEHGGQLTCESTPGQGTSFRLRLPLAPPLRLDAPLAVAAG